MENPFKFVNDEEWKSFAAHAEERSFERNDVLIEEGSRPDGMFVIRDGMVKVVTEPGGYRIIISEHGPGAIFGEMSFIESEPAEASVVAINTARALYIDHERLKAAIADSPMLYGHFYQSLAWILSRRLRRTTSKVGQKKEDAWLDD